MRIRVQGICHTQEDRDAFNALNVWAAQNFVRIDTTFRGVLADIQMEGDDLVMVPMMAYLTEKQHDF